MRDRKPPPVPAWTTAEMYKHFCQCLDMYATPIGGAEAFVAGVEAALDALADEPRPDRYVDYPGAGGFGAESFTSQFERRHRCRLGFVPSLPPFDAELSAACEVRFRRKIVWHAREYLKCRRRLPAERRSARIEVVYEAAIDRPEMFGGRHLCMENFLRAVECGVHSAVGRSEWFYLKQNLQTHGRIGSLCFTDRFLWTSAMRGTPLLIAFVPLDGPYDLENSLELERRFKLEFADHWTKFLEWRRSRQPA